MRFEELHEDGAVLERGVHALTVEGDDGVGCVADQQGAGAGVKGRGVEVGEAADGPGSPLLIEVGHEGQRVGEVLLEEGARRGWLCDGVEAARSSDLQEEGEGEVAAWVGQSDEHEIAARPDVEGCPFEAERAIAIRRDVELFVSMLEGGLDVGEVAPPAQRDADRGVCAVGAHNEVAGNLLLVAGGGVAQRQQPTFRVEVLAGCLESERGACSLGRVEQQGVEVAAGDRTDGLPCASVGLIGERAGGCMHEPPRHLDAERQDEVVDPGELQRGDATRGERKVDGAACGNHRFAEVSAPLDDEHTASLLGEERSEQAAGEPGPDDGDGSFFGQHVGLSQGCSS